MLSEKKIRLMTKMALYEEKYGKEDLKVNEYYRMDYVRLKVIQTILSVTIGLLLVVILNAVYEVEYILAEAVTIDYKELWERYALIYLIILGAYVLLALIGYNVVYGKRRKKLHDYSKNMKLLARIYEKEE